MPKKGDEESKTPTVSKRRRKERSSSESSPITPPAKSVKAVDEEMTDRATDLSGIWAALNKIQIKSTNELLAKNRALCKQYEELQNSLEFNINKLNLLEKENTA